ncbi:sigma-70 family RNA polymerase sigma factor [Candidatus Gottesmanbacteria bacterium]|nr:sigma-70 family RNA polymerase sigma factor [Candidatus Gottesmanbacteria bacterium]
MAWLKFAQELLLISKAKRGDRDAFGKLYLAYLDRVYRYIFFRVGQRREDAEDLSQTTLIRAWGAIGNYSIRKASFRAWLYTIAHNVVIDHYREANRHKTAELTPNIADETSGGVLPEEELETADLTSQVRKALELLSSEHKQIIILRHMEDLSYTEIAKITGKREDAMRALHHRALLALKKVLWHI